MDPLLSSAERHRAAKEALRKRTPDRTPSETTEAPPIRGPPVEGKKRPGRDGKPPRGRTGRRTRRG